MAQDAGFSVQKQQFDSARGYCACMLVMLGVHYRTTLRVLAPDSLLARILLNNTCKACFMFVYSVAQWCFDDEQENSE